MRKSLSITILILQIFLVDLPSTVSAQDETTDVDPDILCVDSLKNVLNSNNLHDSTRVRILCDIVDKMTNYIDEYDSIKKYYQLGREVNKTVKDTCKQIDLLMYWAWGCYYYDNNQEAFSSIFEALNFCVEDSVCIRYKMKVTRTLAIFCLNTGRNSESIDYFRDAIRICNSINDSSYLNTLYTDMAVLYYNLKLYEAVKENCQKSLEISTSLADSAEFKNATICISQANVFLVDTSKILEAVLDEEATLMKYGVNSVSFLDGILVLIQDFLYLCHKTHNQHLDIVLPRLQFWIQKAESLMVVYDKAQFESLKLRYYVVANERDSANFWAKYLLKDLENNNDLDKSEIYAALQEYYKYIGDWKKCLQYFEQREVHEYLTVSLENATKFDKSEMQRKYEERVKMLEKEAEERERMYKTLEARHEMMRSKLWTVIGIIVIIILLTLFFRLLSERMRKILEHQKAEIMSVNEELNTQGEEILVQKEEIEFQRDALELNRLELSQANKFLMSSINYAEFIQRAVVPKEQDLQNMLPESFVFWRPCDIVSGDFYWIAQTEHFKIFVVADCTGHGVPGSLLSMLGLAAFNDIRSNMDNIDSGKILDILQVRIADALSRHSDDVSDGMDLCICKIDVKNMTAQFSGAKRPLILVRNGELTTLKPDRQGIGKDNSFMTTPFTTHNFSLQRGDMLYAFSDGISDQLGGPNAKKFGMPRMRKLLSSMASNNAENQRNILSSTVDDWMSLFEGFSEGKQVDDMLLIGVRI